MSSSSSARKMAPPREKAQKLIALFNAGRYAELEVMAGRMATQFPQSGFVWKVLGTALLMQGKDGTEPLRTAVSLLPEDVEALNNLGNAQKAQGQLEAAVVSYRGAVALKPDYAQGFYNLGIALRELGQLDDAVACYKQATALMPGFVAAHYNLGLAQNDLKQYEQAVASLRSALMLKPDYTEAYCSLGAALGNLGRFDEALAASQCALNLRPDMAEAHHNMGHVLQEAGHDDKALACFEQALKLKPDYVAPRVSMGVALKNLQRYDEAMSIYRQVLALQPAHADAHLELGRVLMEVGCLHEAREHYRRAVDSQPDYTAAWSNLLMASNYVPGDAADELLTQAQAYGKLVASLARPWTEWPNTPDAARPIRVGLVSGDMRQHPVGYFLAGVLPALASSAAGRIELFGYATQGQIKPDALAEAFKACCKGWRNVLAMSDKALAEQVRADGIDILIDLSGHTGHNRLPMFACKPAPVQASWLGYFATTGVAAIDYVIADPWALPQALAPHFTETIWRLPETRLCFSAPQDEVAVSALPATSQGHITFGCFNNLTKVNDEVVALWAQVLQQVPGSRLVLKATQLGDEAVRQSVRARFASHGIADERLTLEGPDARADYLAAYHRIDIGLDPFPFTGGTTSAESLWMGVPVLTLAGDSMVARQGVGLMVNAGLPDWVASDKADYVAKAVERAADVPALAKLRAGLRQQVLASPVFDADRFVQHFEACLRGMWATWCEGQA
jgi:protein O-GlcNAc transferase